MLLQVRTDVFGNRPIARAMKQPNQPAGVANGLLEPQNFLLRPRTRIFLRVFVFFEAKSLIGFCNRKDEKQSVGWPGDEGEQLGFIDAENIVETDSGAQTKLVKERGHHLWIVLWGVLQLPGLGPS
jgi:hypothetical protein